jgi:outer membrane lipoprotein-sorting protein
MKKQTTGGLLLFLALAVPAFCQDANEILKKVGETYASLKSAHFEGATVSETSTGGVDSKIETRIIVAVTEPNKVKIEFQYPNGGDWVRASDGKTTWDYRALTHEYTAKPATAYDINMFNGTRLSAYERIAEGVKSAKLVRSESLSTGGRNVACYVLEVQYPPRNGTSGDLAVATPQPTTYWIDKAKYIVLQESTGSESKSSKNTRTTRFDVASINEPVPDTLFVFDPPRGAKLAQAK